MIHKSLFFLLTLTAIHDSLAMEEKILALSGKDIEKVTSSPTIPLVIKTAALLEERRSNPLPPQPSILERRKQRNTTTVPEEQASGDYCIIQ
jgi:hypothetical protein